jgi:hypothetical protein
MEYLLGVPINIRPHDQGFYEGFPLGRGCQTQLGMLGASTSTRSIWELLLPLGVKNNGALTILPCYKVGKHQKCSYYNIYLRVRKQGLNFKSWFCHFLVSSSWPSYCMPLSFYFLIRIITHQAPLWGLKEKNVWKAFTNCLAASTFSIV